MKWVNIYKDENGRFISNDDFSSYKQAYEEKDGLSTYAETVGIVRLDESTMAEGHQQGEGVKRDLGFAKWLEENTKVIYEPKITLYRFYDNLDGWGNYILDDIYTVYDEKYNYAEDSNAVKECDARDGDSSTFADIINFLEKIDSSSMSDKTWLSEQKNLRQEGKELRERLTGKEIEEVIVKLKK